MVYVPDLGWESAPSDDFAPSVVWTVTESNIAVVCGEEIRIPSPPHPFKSDGHIACLPSLRPILSLIRTVTDSPDPSRYPKKTSTRSKISNLYSKISQSRSRYPGPGDTVHEAESQRGFVPLHGEPARTETFVTANSGGSEQKSAFDRDIEMHGISRAHEVIHVRTDTSVY